jgi:hypothetical protein
MQCIRKINDSSSVSTSTSGYVFIQNEDWPVIDRSRSNVRKNASDHGAIRSQLGSQPAPQSRQNDRQRQRMHIGEFWDTSMHREGPDIKDGRPLGITALGAPPHKLGSASSMSGPMQIKLPATIDYL